jgi:hypothetical protein
MPENTVTAPLAPMEPDDVAATFAYIRALQSDDIDTACAVADDTGPELHRLLLDVAARVFIPITAANDHDGEPCAQSFLAAALGRLLLELLCHGVCLDGLPGIADTITRFTENILTEDHDDVSDVLRHRRPQGRSRRWKRAQCAGPPRSRTSRTAVVRCGARRGAPPHHRGVLHCTIAPRRAPAVRSSGIAAPRRGAPRPGGLLYHTPP